MVLQPAGQARHPSRPHPNPARIFGIAGGIALNIALLMALMLPMDMPMPVLSLPGPTIEIVNIPPDKKPEPAVIPDKKPDPRPPRPQPIARQPETITNQPVFVPDATLPSASDPLVDTQPAADPFADAPPALPAGPPAGAMLGVAFSTRPTYPREALRARIQGRVLLEVLVGTDGTPLKVTISESSGNRELDDAARREVLKRWRFHPAVVDGQAIEASGLVAVEFKLQ